MSDLPTLLRTIAADTEATARVALAGYPERMKPHLAEAAELRAGAARVEALERLAEAAREARAEYFAEACPLDGLASGRRLDDMDEALCALDALEGE